MGDPAASLYIVVKCPNIECIMLQFLVHAVSCLSGTALRGAGGEMSLVLVLSRWSATTETRGGTNTAIQCR